MSTYAKLCRCIAARAVSHICAGALLMFGYASVSAERQGNSTLAVPSEPRFTPFEMVDEFGGVLIGRGRPIVITAPPGDRVRQFVANQY